MDLRKTLHIHSRGKRKKGDTAQLAAQLAPLEEQDRQAAKQQLAQEPGPNGSQADPDFGAIVVDNDNLHVRQDIMEGGGEKTYFGMEPVVLIILAVMLIFIAFVAWQITLMPVE
jgi:hypothetical protein